MLRSSIDQEKPLPFEREWSDVLVLLVPFLGIRSTGRIARVSAQLRAEADYSWRRFAHDQGVRELPRGYTWRAVVRENVAKMMITLRDEHVNDCFLMDFLASYEGPERRACATVGMFEAKFAHYFLIATTFGRNRALT